MLIIRKLLIFIAVIFFFVLGISAADLEYLSDSVIGISILSDDRVLTAQICGLIEQFDCADQQELYRLLRNSEFGDGVSRDKKYFDAEICVMGQIPDGVYDTITICPGDEACTEYLFLIQLKPLSRRFGEMTMPAAAKVQEYYVSFLSVIGKAEKMTLDFIT